ncbi:PEP-CTERM sorting domain-containing protein [Horticoccus luteus]|uniref:PEP-CTERM sorting domain-containing protein n=1 Tax=Horticoccus luteus TaxID=2862869 RepID=A0A8F9TXJ4_9BACT|nr:LamG-like jellyroll fold domain-containing protein [Horticoccus luteus]QYM79699.1 PEP-CTERM sorting domain-containing protein [Horticoccus luteus]
MLPASLRCLVRLIPVAVVMSFATAALSAQTTVRLFRGGEADSAAANAVTLNATAVDSAGLNDASKIGTGGTYTSATAAPGSSLAYDFASTASYQESVITSLNASQSFAMELWFKVPSLTGGSQVLFYNGDTASSGLGLYLNNGSLAVLRGGISVDNFATVTDSAWHYAAFVYDADAQSLDAYFDNQKTVIGSSATSFNFLSGYLSLGNSTHSDNFTGAIDEARLFTFADGTFNTSMLSNPALAAVPEPSTYAAVLGLCVLGFVAWRRRRA